jgi:hypothetical protein
MSDDFQAELRLLGITSSPAFLQAPEGTGIAKRFIHLLKEQRLRVGTFRTITGLRLALKEWLITSNQQCLVEQQGFRPQPQVRRAMRATESRREFHQSLVQEISGGPVRKNRLRSPESSLHEQLTHCSYKVRRQEAHRTGMPLTRQRSCKIIN